MQVAQANSSKKEMQSIPVWNKGLAEKIEELKQDIGDVMGQDISEREKGEEVVKISKEKYDEKDTEKIRYIRPHLERAGLRSVSSNVLTHFVGENSGNSKKAQQQLLVTGQCTKCLKEGNYNPLLKTITLDKDLDLGELVANHTHYFKKDEDLRKGDLSECAKHQKTGELTSSVQRIILPGGIIIDIRIKSGYELVKKMTEYAMGERNTILDAIAYRIIAPEELYIPLSVKLLRDWVPNVSFYNLEGEFSLMKPQNKVHKVEEGRIVTYDLIDMIEAYCETEGTEEERAFVQEELSKFKGCYEERGLSREVNIKGTKQEIPIWYVELTTPLDKRGNVVNGLIYPTEQYNSMEKRKGYNALEYHAKKFNEQAEKWTLAHWMFAELVAGNVGLLPNGTAPLITKTPQEIIVRGLERREAFLRANKNY